MTKGNVVITGASTGIGEASALRLDEIGFTVYAGVRRQADGESLQAKSSGRIVPLLLDVTDAHSIATAARVLEGRPLAGLVNNAGVNVSAPVELVPLDRLRMQLEVNVVGQVAVTQSFLPHLRLGPGRIVNIGSIGGRGVAPIQGPYSASKFALEAINDALRLELKPWGIEVSMIEPGAIKTPIWDKGISDADELFTQIPEDQRRLYANLMETIRSFAVKTSGAAIPPSEVARVVEHALTAARPKTRYIVGKDAKMQAIVNRLPDRWRDRVIYKFLGLS